MANVVAMRISLNEEGKKDLAWLAIHGYYSDALEAVHLTLRNLRASYENQRG